MQTEPPGEQRAGVDEQLVREISAERAEPAWLLEQRLEAFRLLADIDGQSAGDASEFDLPLLDVAGLVRVAEPPQTWPTDVTPSTAEAASALTGGNRAGQQAQIEAEQSFHHHREQLRQRGVVFCDLNTAVQDHPELVRAHLGLLIRSDTNRFAALNTAVWSGGAFIHVPAGVELDVPLQSYARVRSESPARFDRVLIVAEEGAVVHYIDGCAAPVYSAQPIRSSVVEIVAQADSTVSYTTMQNWSANVVNVVSAGAVVDAGARLRWTTASIGSKRTVQRPNVRLAGPGASAVVQSIGYAGSDQRQDLGAELVHTAPNTSARVVARSVMRGGGAAMHRSVVRSNQDGDRQHSEIDERALRADGESSDPAMATIDREQIFYLMSRGLSESNAVAAIVDGFISPITESLPTEYAVEWSRLIELQLEAIIG